MSIPYHALRRECLDGFCVDHNRCFSLGAHDLLFIKDANDLPERVSLRGKINLHDIMTMTSAR